MYDRIRLKGYEKEMSLCMSESKTEEEYKDDRKL